VRPRINVHFNKIISVPESCSFFHCIRIVHINKMKTDYLPHPWTRPTYGAKRHSDPIHRYSTMHWTDRRTDACMHRQIVQGKVWRL